MGFFSREGGPNHEVLNNIKEAVSGPTHAQIERLDARGSKEDLAALRNTYEQIRNELQS